MKVIVADKKIDCEHLLGQFLDESHYDTLIEEDADVYMPHIPGQAESLSEERVILKFRKNYFTQEQQNAAYAGLREAATETQNR